MTSISILYDDTYHGSRAKIRHPQTAARGILQVSSRAILPATGTIRQHRLMSSVRGPNSGEKLIAACIATAHQTKYSSSISPILKYLTAV